MPFSPKLVRIVRRLLISLAVFVTLIALVFVVENWRGDRAWKKYAAEHAARGEIFDALPNPSTLPPEVNFFKTPVIDRWAYDEKFEDFLIKIAAPNLDSGRGITKGWTAGRATDFKRVVEALKKDRKKPPAQEAVQSAVVTPSAQVLELLAPMESMLVELRQAARQRPESQLTRLTQVPRNWGTFHSPNGDFPFAIETALSLHASASLAEQHPEIAFEDVMAGLKFSRGFSDAPDAVLIETLVGAALLQQSLQPIWEGLQHHAWSDDQLAKIQQEITKTDLFYSLDRTFHTERAMCLDLLEHLPSRTIASDMREQWIWRSMPHGWIQQNKISYCVLSAPYFQIVSACGTRDFLPRLSNIGKYPKGFDRFTAPYTVFASRLLKGMSRLPENIAPYQAFRTLAETACALERYRLAHGNYPGSLPELVPTYLDKVPLDIINGQPLTYRRTDSGKFILYSVGLDGKDDGGKPATSDSEGDLAWPQPVEN